MRSWLDAALEYVSQWLEFQLRYHDQPGCQVAITHNGKVVLEQAFGVADLSTGEAFTPSHLMRAASHSKSFTAAGVLRLHEQGELRLDDRVEQYVQDLNPAVGRATIAQLLSHSAGLTRDGRDCGQFSDRRPYLSRDELMADLREAPPLAPGERFKYSNHGYGLLGLIMETVTGEPYADWITREVVKPSGLEAVAPDITLARGATAASCRSDSASSSRGTTRPTPSCRQEASWRPQAVWRGSSTNCRQMLNEASCPVRAAGR